MVILEDKNRIIIGKFCAMELYKGRTKKSLRFHTFFDKEHLNKVIGKRWSVDGRGYVRTTGTTLHQIIMGEKKGFEIDHIDRWKLNNRDKNLRFVTRSQNVWNKKYLGMYRHTQTGNWVVQMKVNKKRYYFGCFKTKKEALLVRKKAEIKYRKYE